MMNPVAKLLIIGGIIMVIIGLFWQFGWRFFPVGRLPGDIIIDKGNFKFYFPIVTSIVASIILTLLFWLFRIFLK